VAPPWPTAVEDGWVSRSYGIKEAAPIVVAIASDVECADFFTLLMPLAAGAHMPEFAITHDVIEGEPSIIAEIRRTASDGDRCDRVLWTASGRAVSFPDVGVAAAAAVLNCESTARARIALAHPVDVSVKTASRSDLGARESKMEARSSGNTGVPV
jgi:hypothetical protein